MTTLRCPGINFFPFCKTELTANCLYIAEQCVGCDHAYEAGLASNSSSAVGPRICNPNVSSFPLPLSDCPGFCDKQLIGGCLAFLLVTCIGTIALNTWSTLVWASVQRKRPQIYFKLSLTLSDLLFGLCVLPQAAFHLVNTMYGAHREFYQFQKLIDINSNPLEFRAGWLRHFSPSNSQASVAILYVTQGASLFSILLLTVDRHIAIARSIRYPRIMTKCKALLLIALTWVLVTAMSVITAVTIGKYWVITVTPSVFFLPIPEPDDFQLYTNTILVYLMPLLVVFLANVCVTLMTSRALSRTAVTSHARSSPAKRRGRKKDSDVIVTSPVTTATYAFAQSSVSNDSVTSETQTTVKAPIDKEAQPSLSVQPLSPTIEQKHFEMTEIAEKKKPHGSSMWRRISSLIYGKYPANLRDSLQEHRQANRTMMLILLAYTVCVLPMGILLLLNLFQPDLTDVTGSDGLLLLESNNVAKVLCVGLFLTSSLWNGVIYNVRNREYRRAGKALLKKMAARCVIWKQFK